MEPLKYLYGIRNDLKSEAPGYEGSLPDTRNPQKLKHDLVAEQLSGEAFTAPRARNKRSWLYRRNPSVCHEPMKLYDEQLGFDTGTDVINQTRWYPFVADKEKMENNWGGGFVDGLNLIAYSDASGYADSSVAIYFYEAPETGGDEYFVNMDGDFLFVPQDGTILIRTEFGDMLVEPNEIAVVQQGMKFTVTSTVPSSHSTTSKGYILEVRGNHFELPELGPIGANGLAEPTDFQVPVARVDLHISEYRYCIRKYRNKLFNSTQKHTPFDVAAWLGNYFPYKYNLEKFVALNSVSVDHPDPSIFTVLTCPSIGKPGTALADFVIFPPRWECANATFRPPYFHVNCMTEFMGLIKGSYQAKGGKFAPGGASLHQSMMPHGPDYECYKKAIQQDASKPSRVADGTMAFMFETSKPLKVTEWAMNQEIDHEYHKCWEGLCRLPELRDPGS